MCTLNPAWLERPLTLGPGARPPRSQNSAARLVAYVASRDAFRQRVSVAWHSRQRCLRTKRGSGITEGSPRFWQELDSCQRESLGLQGDPTGPS